MAAHPGLGKTVFGMQACLASAERGEKCAFLSFEMPAIDLKERVRTRVKSKEEWLANVSFPKTRRVTASTVGQNMERIAQDGVRLIVVDYVQKIPEPDSDDYDRINLAIAGITDAAKHANICAIVLAQPSRDGNRSSAKGKAPSMHDLKGSGNLEQDAAWVGFLWDKENNRETAPREKTWPLVVVCAKDRYGGNYGEKQVVMHRPTGIIASAEGAAHARTTPNMQYQAPIDDAAEDLFA